MYLREVVCQWQQRDPTSQGTSYGEWGSIFGDTIIAGAILDRLLHRSITGNIRGESYRLREKRKAGMLTPSREVNAGQLGTWGWGIRLQGTLLCR